ncbi:MAG TPA: MmcQ/YjbR family DNA-binding protein [Holophagaceae bacterium]|nr:MmcQ/YjbR family DNA-binding protein [Holophagaceae bacterium]
MRRLALALPGVEEGTSYGTPAFKVRGKLFARLHQDGDALVLRVEPEVRGAMMAAKSDHFFITDHYRDYSWVLARFGQMSEAELQAALEDACALARPQRRSKPGPGR